MKKLGIVQARGLGDILIALPIAQYYSKRDWDVLWPISEQFHPSLKDACPWVQWLPFMFDGSLAAFLDEPMKLLESHSCDKTLTLYSYLTGRPEFCSDPYSQVCKFDQVKYQRAAVPFTHKWELWSCIERNDERESALFDRLVKKKDYLVFHSKGSNFSVDFQFSSFPEDWQYIEIVDHTDNIFDWLKILENARALVMIDSVFANLVDQLELDVVKYWMPRSGVMFTPVLGSQWNILDAPEAVKQRIQYFPPHS